MNKIIEKEYSAPLSSQNTIIPSALQNNNIQTENIKIILPQNENQKFIINEKITKKVSTQQITQPKIP